MQPLVTIIMPVFNAARHIGEAIDSVLAQTYDRWQLIIVNDGSSDASEMIIRQFHDSRIEYHYQENGGVSKARNAGLRQMKGTFFCFLDADDVMPPGSLMSRVKTFQNDPKLSFVDGVVLKKDEHLKKTISTYMPNFHGYARAELLRLSSRCFLGNTWMVRRNHNYHYAFNENLTHLEDYLFFLEISDQGLYNHVPEEILWYRQSEHSAMRDLAGLEKGYDYIYRHIRRNSMANFWQLIYLKYRIVRICFLSNLLLAKKPGRAFKSLLNFLP